MRNFSILLIIPVIFTYQYKKPAEKQNKKQITAQSEISYLSFQGTTIKTTLIKNIKKNIISNNNYIKNYIKNNIPILKTAFIKALSELPYPHLHDNILSYLNDGNPSVKIESITAIGNTRNKKYSDILYDLCDKYKDNESIFIPAISSLSELKSNESSDRIASFYAKTPQYLSTAVILSLGACGNENSAKHLIRLYNESEEWEKKFIITALGNCLNSKSADFFLNKLLKHPNTPYFGYALIAASNIESESNFKIMLESIKNVDENIKRASIYAISRIGKIEGLNPLINEISQSNGNNNMNDFIYSSLEYLCAFYPEETIMKNINDKNHPAFIANQLGNIADKSSIEVLAELLNHDDPINRISAVSSLSKIKDTAVKDVILKRIPQSTPLEFFYELKLMKQWHNQSTVTKNEVLSALKGSFPLDRKWLFLAFIGETDIEEEIFRIIKDGNNNFQWLAIYSVQYIPNKLYFIDELKNILIKDKLINRYFCAVTLSSIAKKDKETAGFLKQANKSEKNPIVKKILNDI